MEVELSPHRNSGASSTTAIHRQYFAYAVRAALLVIVSGYALDVVLSLMVLPSSGLDVTMVISTSPSEDPYSMMGFLSLVLLGFGHGLLIFSLLLWTLARPGFMGRVQTEGQDQIALAVGVSGLVGLLTLLSGPREVAMQALTYVDTIGVDLLVVMAIAITAWVRLGGSNRAGERKSLIMVTLASMVTGLASMAVTVENSWLTVIFATSTLIVLHEISKLFETFMQPVLSGSDKTSLKGPSL